MFCTVLTQAHAREAVACGNSSPPWQAYRRRASDPFPRRQLMHRRAFIMAVKDIQNAIKDLHDSFNNLESRPLSRSESKVLRDIELKLLEVFELFEQLNSRQPPFAPDARVSVPIDPNPTPVAGANVTLSSSRSSDPPALSQTSNLEGNTAPRAYSPPHALGDSGGNEYSSSTLPLTDTLPVVRCSMEEWRDFPCVLDRAIALGAKETGAFKTPLDVSGMWHERQNSAVRCKEYDVALQASGVYEIITRETKQKLSWSRTTTSDVSSVLKEQTSRLNNDGGLSGVFYRTDVRAKTAAQRKTAGLSANSMLWPLPGNRLDETFPPIDGIHTPYFYQSGPAPGALFAMHVEDARLYSINILHKGRKLWIIIPPRSRKQLERHLREDNPDARCCSQFVRHLNIFIPVAKLKAWGIDFSIADQRAGEAIVTFEDTYHEGFSVGSSAAEAINYAAKDWNRQDYTFCSDGCFGPWIPESLFAIRTPEATLESLSDDHRATSRENVTLRPRKQCTKKLPGDTANRAQNAPNSLSCSASHTCLLAGPDRIYQHALEDVATIQQQQKARIIQMIMQCSPGCEESMIEKSPIETQKVISRIVSNRRQITQHYMSLRQDYMKLAAIYAEEVIRIKGCRRAKKDKKRRLANGGLRSKKKRGKGGKSEALESMLGQPPQMARSDLKRCIEWGDCLTELRNTLGPRCLRTFPATTCFDLAASFTTGLAHFPELAKPIAPEEYHSLREESIVYFVKWYAVLRPELRDPSQAERPISQTLANVNLTSRS